MGPAHGAHRRPVATPSSREFTNPKLPPFLDEMTLHNITLERGRISLLIRRMGNEVALNVIERHGDVHVVVRS